MYLRPVAAAVLLLLWSAAPGRAQGEVSPKAIPQTAPHALVVTPDDCTRELVPRLQAEFEPALTAQSRSSLEGFVAKSKGAAKSWHDVAVILYVEGKPVAAAWAALKSLGSPPKPSYVASAGTIVAAAGRRAEGRQLLLCARGLGDNSPYTLEALAAVEAALGDRGAAKAAIDEIANDALGDPMIDIEQSLLDTGKPPPPAPRPVEPLQRCAADLDRHMESVIAEITRRDVKYTQLAQLAHDAYFDGPVADNAQRQREATLARLKTMIQKAAAAPRSDGGMSFNAALSYCVLQYFLFTGIAAHNYLNFPQAVMLWARALQISPEGFIADMASPATLGSPSVESAATRKQYADDIRTNDRTNDSNKCPSGPGNQACADAMKLAHCTKWQSLFDGFSDATKQRYDAAAHGFDNAAVEALRAVYVKVDDARGFAIRNFRYVKPGPRMPNGDSFGAGLVKGLKNDIRLVVDPLLTRDADRFLQEQGRNFSRNRENALARLDSMQKTIDDHCTKVIYKSVFDELEREAYDEYQKELWDRLAADIKTDYDGKIDCTIELGGMTLDIGEDGTKLSSKWQNFKAKLDDTGEVKVSGSWKSGPLGVNVDQSGKVQISGGTKGGLGGEGEGEAGIGGGITVQGGEITGASIGGSVDPGGIEGEGSITIFSDRHGESGSSEPALLVKGSVSVGGSVEGVGSVKCTPGEFSAEIYPRSFVADAVTYVLSAR